MERWKIWLWLILLIIIHTIDMILTQRYVGAFWQFETFPPMSFCIRNFGINISLWTSRIIIYSLIYLTLYLGNKIWWARILVVGTILYWTAMVNWLFFLGYLKFPI